MPPPKSAEIMLCRHLDSSIANITASTKSPIATDKDVAVKESTIFAKPKAKQEVPPTTNIIGIFILRHSPFCDCGLNCFETKNIRNLPPKFSKQFENFGGRGAGSVETFLAPTNPPQERREFLRVSGLRDAQPPVTHGLPFRGLPCLSGLVR